MRRKLIVALALLWVVKWFNTADELVTFLNGLSPARQLTAKVLVAPSSRNVLGFAGQPYGLVYQQEN